MDNQTSPQENPQPTQPTIEAVNTAPQQQEQLSQKDVNAAKKKSFEKKVKLFLFIFGIVIVLMIISAFVWQIYTKNKKQFEVNEQIPDETDIVIKEEDPISTEDWQRFSSDKYRFIFDYPKEDKFSVSDDTENAYFVKIVSSDTVPVDNPDGFVLVKGYIFEIKPLAIAARNINKIVEIKSNWFKENCPDTATIGEKKTDTKISDITTTGFEVSNCNSDFVVNYLSANNYVYEIVQTFKGDIGFKQNYKLRTEQMLASLKIDQLKPEEPDYLEYEDKIGGYSFTYPRTLDSTCCKVPEPPISNTRSILTLSSTGGNESAVGFFTTNLGDRQTYDQFLQNFENLLTDDYKVIKGKPPEGEKINLVYNNYDFVRLNGYSWRGNNFIIAKTPDDRNVVIISIMGFPEDSLEQIMSTVLFEFK